MVRYIVCKYVIILTTLYIQRRKLVSYPDPNQSGQYGAGYNPNQPPPAPQDPYSGQGQGQYYTPPSGQQPPYGQQQQPPYGQQQQPPYGQQQQPPYGQQQQPPYGQQQPPYGGASPDGSTMNLAPNIAAMLSYLFGWISGLVIFLLEKQNRTVRFHAMQSILFFGSISVVEF